MLCRANGLTSWCDDGRDSKERHEVTCGRWLGSAAHPQVRDGGHYCWVISMARLDCHARATYYTEVLSQPPAWRPGFIRICRYRWLMRIYQPPIHTTWRNLRAALKRLHNARTSQTKHTQPITRSHGLPDVLWITRVGLDLAEWHHFAPDMSFTGTAVTGVARAPI